jgi:hypothetical protein
MNQSNMDDQLKPRKTPQENKILGYTNQTENCYGENDKSSRKAIHDRKATVNRNYRRVGKQILSQTTAEPEDLSLNISEQQKIEWKKVPDAPLITQLFGQEKEENLNELQKEAIKRLKKGNHHRL